MLNDLLLLILALLWASNAAGRLDDMSFGVELLMSNNIHAARRMASELDGLNQSRKEIEEGMKQEAMAFVSVFNLVTRYAIWASSLSKRLAPRVIGILASRIKDFIVKIAFADGGEER